MQQLLGTVRNYPWGTMDAIPALLGRQEDGRPQAEYWLGAHPLAPAHVDGRPLDEVVRDRGADLLGEPTQRAFGQLPFLMKVLSARHALSIQAHPSRSQAEEGFAREEEAGIPLDADERTYKDPWPKPELLVALNEFHGLIGFRSPKATARLFEALGVDELLSSVIGPLTQRKGSAALAEVFLDVLSLDDDRKHLVNEVTAAAVSHVHDPNPVGEFARTAVELDEFFPSDPGILAALLLNRCTLQPGEALFVPAGELHAHLHGTGIEVMANSDNVIRGGLTSKHIDVSELVKVVNFSPTTNTIVNAREIRTGVWKYPASCREFEVWRVSTTPEHDSTRVPGRGSARVAMVVSGEVHLESRDQVFDLRRGEAVLLGAGEDNVLASGRAEMFVTASGLREV